MAVALVLCASEVRGGRMGRARERMREESKASMLGPGCRLTLFVYACVLRACRYLHGCACVACAQCTEVSSTCCSRSRRAHRAPDVGSAHLRGAGALFLPGVSPPPVLSPPPPLLFVSREGVHLDRTKRASPTPHSIPYATPQGASHTRSWFVVTRVACAH